MKDDPKTLGIIPARGGSKGVPRKNLRLVGGKPLIHWTVLAALAARTLDRVILSSDDDEIMDAAALSGCEVPFKRPSELSGDKTPTIDVVLHALKELPGYNIVVLLQPTSPLREPEDIDTCVRKCALDGQPSCCTVSRVTKGPNWMFFMDDNGKLDRFLKEEPMTLQRQDLPNLYAPNGAVYAVETEFFAAQRSFLSPETVGIHMPERRSVDIDTEFDLEICDLLLRTYKRF